MGKPRFLYNNFITSESMIAVSSLRNGIVTSAKKDGTGSAAITTAGNYTGTTDLEYIVEIDSIVGGAEVGQATFKWSDGGGTWDATGVTTSAVAINLNNGVTVFWTTGSGADFVVGDRWYFKGINLFSAGKLIDNDRNHRYRSAALGAPNTITITLTAEAQVDALVIFDHNFTSAATIVLWGDDAATFDSDGGAAQVIETITWASSKILHYLTTADRTKRYWQLRITDASNPDSYIEIGELFLGNYTELSRSYEPGFSRTINLLHESNVTPYGTSRKRFYNQQISFKYDFGCLSPSDFTLLKTMINTITDRDTGIFKSFFFNDDSATVSNNWLVDILKLSETHQALNYYNTTIELTEAVKSV